MLRQAQNSYVDRSLLKVLVDVLAEDGLINKKRLEQLWSKQCENEEGDRSQGADAKPRANLPRKSPTQKNGRPNVRALLRVAKSSSSMSCAVGRRSR